MKLPTDPNPDMGPFLIGSKTHKFGRLYFTLEGWIFVGWRTASHQIPEKCCNSFQLRNKKPNMTSGLATSFWFVCLSGLEGSIFHQSNPMTSTATTRWLILLMPKIQLINQLSLLVCPIICKGSTKIPGAWPWDFSINSSTGHTPQTPPWTVHNCHGAAGSTDILPSLQGIIGGPTYLQLCRFKGCHLTTRKKQPTTKQTNKPTNQWTARRTRVRCSSTHLTEVQLVWSVSSFHPCGAHCALCNCVCTYIHIYIY